MPNPTTPMDLTGYLTATGNGSLLTNLPGIVGTVGRFTMIMTTASGSQTVTGLGFQPSKGMFIAGMNAANNAAVSIGFDDGVNRNAIQNEHNQAANTWDFRADVAIDIIPAINARFTVVVASWTSTGFTMNYSGVNAVTGTLNVGYIVIM